MREVRGAGVPASHCAAELQQPATGLLGAAGRCRCASGFVARAASSARSSGGPVLRRRRPGRRPSACHAACVRKPQRVARPSVGRLLMHARGDLGRRCLPRSDAQASSMKSLEIRGRGIRGGRAGRIQGVAEGEVLVSVRLRAHARGAGAGRCTRRPLACRAGGIQGERRAVEVELPAGSVVGSGAA